MREIVEKIIAVTDTNKDGKINFEEFVSVSSKPLSESMCLLRVNWFKTTRL